MTDRTGAAGGWFADLDPDNDEEARDTIENGRATVPDSWPTLAVDSGYVDSTAEYYERLHTITVQTAASMAKERERAADQQLVHAIRALDDVVELSNELAERLAEWANSYYDETGGGSEYAREVATREPRTATEERIVGLATSIAGLEDQREELTQFLESETPRIAPNLAALAGPRLAARLISLAGGLEDLAKKPSGTLQVLGAEDALFAHLAGRAPSPKHGVIFTHDAVRNTRPEERGSAARALAGKLTIAARIDHYAGDRRPELDAELEDRIDRIRSRGEE